MRVEELSIGDWVKVDDFDKVLIQRVVAIDATRREIGIIKNNRGGIYWYYEDEIEPIPLTPEIVDKNGFRLVVVNKKFYDWHDNNITIRKYYNEDNYHLFVCSQKIEFKMLFIHQLQHALRLAGVGKEIEL
jgi:hypothetical protein